MDVEASAVSLLLLKADARAHLLKDCGNDDW